MRKSKGTFRRALEISLLLHLLLVFLILPKLHSVWPDEPHGLISLRPELAKQQSPPLEFEFVDLAEEQEEKPVSDRVPLSDLDRRAHGGEGEAALRASSQGNTRQLVQADGGTRLDSGIPPQQPAPPSRQVPEPQSEDDRRPQEQPQTRTQPEGAGDERELEPGTSGEPTVKLPPPGTWAMPPKPGGLLENPKREGGRVDTGALSFDTQWYDWGPYAKAMLAKIRRNWRIPEIARMGVEGVVKVRYFIERDGTVTGLTIVDESGRPPMDFAARDAIAHSSPFEPLPSDLTGVNREGVTITFYYNTDPPSRGNR